MDRTLFAQNLATTPHLSSGGLSGMVYEHLFGCFMLEDPSSRFLELQATVATAVHEDILRSMALVLRASRLLTMARDISGLRPIAVGEMFF
jgi:hypothetical protein